MQIIKILATAIASVAVATFITASLGGKPPFMIFFVAVVASTWYGRIYSGVTTVALSGFIAFSLFVQNKGSFGLLNLFIFFLVGSIIAVCIDNLHRVNTRLARKRRELAEAFTEQKNMEEKLREEHRLKDEFLATLAHELRNPLAPINSGLSILQATNPSDDRFKKALVMMERQVNQMTRMIDDLLDVSRVARGKIELRKETFSIQSCIEQVVESSRPLCEGNCHKITVNVPKEPLVLYADPARTQQVFTNLLNNAAKYTPQGGEITIMVAQVADNVVTTIKDTGLGISPENLEHIFTLFFQVDNSIEKTTSGLGIGLTLVRKLVELHHGTISCHSEGEGKGTEFTVTLPMLGKSVSTEDTAVLPALPAKNNSKKILIVDDNCDAATTLQMLLEIYGHTVYVANDGPSGLESYRHHKPSVVIQDIGMPGMNGYEVARQLRKEGSKSVIIALTGYGMEKDRANTQEAGFDCHLTKPVPIEDLNKIIDQL